MLFLLGVYVWTMTSGKKQMFIDQGKSIVRSLVVWFEDAQIDYQLEKGKKAPKKRARRWD